MGITLTMYRRGKLMSKLRIDHCKISLQNTNSLTTKIIQNQYLSVIRPVVFSLILRSSMRSGR